KAVKAGVKQGAVQLAPPGPDLWIGKVGEITIAGPNRAAERPAVGQLAEKAAGQPFVVNGIARIHLDARIDDGDGVKTLLVQVGRQAWRIGKPLGAPGKDSKAVHIIDVEVDGVAGDAAAAELGSQGADLAFRRVAPAA